MTEKKNLRGYLASAFPSADAIDLAYFALYAAFFLFLASQHALFRDEGQPWLRAIRTPSLGEFFEAIRYTRYPPLHFLLMRAANDVWGLLFPTQWYRISSFISWSFHFGSVGLLIFGFRAPRWLRYGAPLGIAFFFDHGIVTHTYHLGDFFLILAVWLKTRGKQRGSWISLMLAANVHLIYTLVAGGFFAWDLWESRKQLRGRDLAWAAFCSLGFLGSLLFMVIAPPDIVFPDDQKQAVLSLKRAVNFFDMGMTGWQSYFAWTKNPFLTWAGALIPVVLFGAMALQGFPLVPYAVTVLPLFLFFLLRFEPGRRHAFMFFLAALLWILIQASKSRDGKRVPLLFAVFCLGTMACTGIWLKAWNPFQRQPNFDYSGSKELVEKIGPQLKDKDAVFVASPSLRYMSVAAILDIVPFEPISDSFAPFPSFKQSDEKMSFEQWCGLYGGKLKEKFPGKKVYFGVKKGMDPPPAACGPYREIFRSTRIHTKYNPGGEDFVVYEALR
jgi:hypothetical protein